MGVQRTAPVAIARRIDEKIMNEPRSSEPHTKASQEMMRHWTVGTNDRIWAVAGRMAYREEFQRDYGPDSDERLDPH